MSKFAVKVGVVVCAVMAAVACEKNQKKANIHRGFKEGQGTSNEWAKEVMSTEAGGCLRLVQLANMVRATNAELISIHTSDLDFASLTRETVKTTQLSQDKKTKVTVTGFRPVFTKVDGVSDQTKVNYFFKTQVIPVAETFPGTDVLRSLQVRDMLSISEQDSCQSVTFLVERATHVLRNGQRFGTAQSLPVKFNVVFAGRNTIALENQSGTIRTYTMLPNDQILMSEATLALNIPICSGAALPGNTYEVRSYILAKSRTKQRYQINKNLAQMFRYIYDTPELTAIKPAAVRGQAAPAMPKGRTSDAGSQIILSGSTLEFLARATAVKGPALTCALPDIARTN
jgi:hypothetical protein